MIELLFYSVQRVIDFSIKSSCPLYTIWSPELLNFGVRF